MTTGDTNDNGRYQVSPRINIKSPLFQGNNKFSMDFVQKRLVGGGLESFGAEGLRERALVRAGCLSFFSALAALGISGLI
jgi:hypothetical protein